MEAQPEVLFRLRQRSVDLGRALRAVVTVARRESIEFAPDDHSPRLLKTVDAGDF